MQVNMKFVKNLALFWFFNIFGFLLFSVSGSTIKVNVFYNGLWSSGQYMPDKINVTMNGTMISVSMRLGRVTHPNDELPVYTISVDDSGQLIHTRELVSHNIAYYQDVEQNAVFLVTCHEETPQQERHLQFSGQFYFDGSLYTLVSPDKHLRSSRGLYVIQREKEAVEVINSQPPGRSIGEPPYEVNSGGEGHRRRPRRDTPTSYYIDIVAVVDYKAYTRFYQMTGDRLLAIGSLTEYYGFVLSGVDMMYQSIKNPDFQIRVRLIKIVVAETLESSSFTETFQVPDVPHHTVDDDLALTALKEYVNGPGHAVVTPNDHVILFTGYDVTRRSNGFVSKKAAGRAYQGTLCQTNGYSTSIIEDIKGFGCIGIAAHELGHSFSADHDGEGNDCQSSDRYIMSVVSRPATSATKVNPWKFSNCSEQQIALYVRNLLNTSSGQKCLKEMLPAEPTVLRSGPNLPGLKYSADEQCRMIYGNSSFLCPRIPPFDLFTDPSNICTEMYCYQPVERTCYNSVPAQGTVCGSGKVCVSGECVQHLSAPTFNETCMFGDDPMELINGLNCSRAISQFPFFCYDSELVISCCESCRDIYRPVQGCEYGDRVTGCKANQCHGSYITSCCETCGSQSDRVTQRTTSVTGEGVCTKDNPNTSINGGTCQDTVSSFPFFCYIENVFMQCCESCRKINTSIAGCEYGDHVIGCSEAHCHEASPSLHDCCGTCKVGIPAGSTGAVSSDEPETTHASSITNELLEATSVMQSAAGTTGAALFTAVTSGTSPDSKVAAVEPPTSVKVAAEDTTSKDRNILTPSLKGLIGVPSSASEINSVAVGTLSTMLTSPAETESMTTLLPILKKEVTPPVETSSNQLGAITVDPSVITTGYPSGITTGYPSGITTVSPSESNNMIAIESSAPISSIASTSLRVNIPNISDVAKQSKPPTTKSPTGTSTLTNLEQPKTITTDHVVQPSSTSQPPHIQLQLYVSRQQTQLQQHLLEQQSLLERLLQHDLLHQENTLLHHQPHVKQLLHHYLRHQKHLLEYHLSQQRALLQAHLRNQEILQSLCKN